MEFSVHKLQTFKLAAHIIQAVLIFIGFILMIAIFTGDASIDGRPGWFFGLCFLTFPAIIFLTMSPRFPRTRKLAHPYALATVDILYTILWLSAFAAVANWKGDGKCKNRCGTASGEIAIGVFIWLFWCLTTAMSVYGCIYYRNNGYLPGGSRAPNNAAAIDPDKEAFSTAPHDDEYAPVHNPAHDHDEEEGYPGPSEVPRYDNGPVFSGGALGENPGGEYVSPMQHEDTSYTGYAPQIEPAYPGRAQFPEGNYS